MHNYTKVNALQQHAALRSLLVTKTALLVHCSNLAVLLPNTNLVTAPTQFFANFIYIYIYLFIYTQSIRILLNVEQFWFFFSCWTMFHAITDNANCLSLINSKEVHEILTAVLLRIKVLWNTVPCRSVTSSTFQTVLLSAYAGPSSPRTSIAWTSTRRLDPDDKELRSFEKSETV